MASIDQTRVFKAIPQQLCMSEASPFCQPWNYASDHPMEFMLMPHYFRSEHERIRPGDTIRIVQMKDKNVVSHSNKVVAFADVTVIESSRDGIVTLIDRGVDVAKMQKKTEAVKEPEVGEGAREGDSAADGENPGDSESEEETPHREWNRRERVHEAVVGEGDNRKVLYSHTDKEKVEEWLQSLAS